MGLAKEVSSVAILRGRVRIRYKPGPPRNSEGASHHPTCPELIEPGTLGTRRVIVAGRGSAAEKRRNVVGYVSIAPNFGPRRTWYGESKVHVVKLLWLSSLGLSRR